MFQLSVQDIHPGEKAGDKEEAIRQVAAALVQAGNVAEGYVNGMLAREQQTSTFLGNGIAIPHGTTDTRDQVLKTGVQVFQFPEGVTWGDGQVAYVAIGIAASSDEHLGLLRQLTHVLSDDSVAEQLKSATTAEELRALLMGEKQSEQLKLDNEMLTLDIITFETLFYFQPGTDIRKTHFVQRSGTAGSGRLNINILNQQQFAVVIQYHTFFNFVRSWHRKIPVVENVKNIATKYSRRAFRASGIRTFAGAKKVVLCALINPVVNLKRTTYGMPSGLRGVLHCPFNFQPYSRYARWQARQYALHSA